jgi:hypothetical protein
LELRLQNRLNAGERALIGFAHIFFADRPEIEPELSLYNEYADNQYIAVVLDCILDSASSP